MKIQDMHIVSEVERLAAELKWETVDLWVRREPEGAYSFVAYAHGNKDLGINPNSGHAQSPAEAVDELLRIAGGRDPETQRQRAIADLEEKLAKLKGAEFGLPPYRPSRELTEGTINVPDPTINV